MKLGTKKLFKVFTSATVCAATILLNGPLQAADESPPEVTRYFSPYYPTRAQRNKLEGVVELDVTVSTRGLAREVRVVKSSGSDLLDLLAKHCVLQWGFKPATKIGRKIEQTCRQSVRFKAPTEAEWEQLEDKASSRLKHQEDEEKQAFPFYPRDAMQKGVQGEAEVLVAYAPSGTVTNVWLRKSAGHLHLDLNALLTAYCKSDLEPGKIQSAATNVFTAKYRFQL